MPLDKLWQVGSNFRTMRAHDLGLLYNGLMKGAQDKYWTILTLQSTHSVRVIYVCIRLFLLLLDVNEPRACFN